MTRVRSVRSPQPSGRSCRGKTGYRDRAGAEMQRDRFIAGGSVPEQLRAYHCRHCGMWHVGHIPGVKRRSR